eukprot:CAMPEP_0198722598 /NCGR_PEP_ID=MMETSP1475-20131203/269_1 /TAXON_ID= ORGANISM="Unidentified sp., Strain CCMP1999" /NCGR_SAMPLE_ID=MMETSP1475 /ASSEMBLY_ACC=CAM_ASM_001111 /LENGTH=331 /DNA_ID=CAMNT_0044483511 /DNA_START=66 /DNA_END=1061 /DNA_ORIENTATION=-
MAGQIGVAQFGEACSARNKPDLFLETYGTSYGLDIFTLGHNAVRRDISDLFDMLLAYELRRGDVHLGDVNELFKWLKPMTRFLLDIIALEERLIFPWVTAAAPGLQGEVGSKERLELKEKIIKGIRETQDIKKNCAHMAPMGVFRKVLESVNKWVRMLLDYFYHEEHSLPGIIEAEYTVEEKVHLDQRIAEFFVESDGGGAQVCMLIRWMDSKQAAYWKENNLSVIQRLQFRNWEMFYNRQRNLHAKVLKKSGLESSEMETKHTVVSDQKKQLRKTWAELKKEVEAQETERVRHEMKHIDTEIGANVKVPQFYAERKARKSSKASKNPVAA